MAVPLATAELPFLKVLKDAVFVVWHGRGTSRHSDMCDYASKSCGQPQKFETFSTANITGAGAMHGERIVFRAGSLFVGQWLGHSGVVFLAFSVGTAAQGAMSRWSLGQSWVKLQGRWFHTPTSHFTLHGPHSTLHIPHKNTIPATLPTPHSHSSLHILHATLHSLSSTLDTTVQSTLHASH